MIKGNSFLRDIYIKSRLYLGLIRAQWTKRPVPLVVNLFITGRCNCRCNYCYVEFDKPPEGHEFTLKEWKKLIDDLYDRGCRFYALVGGEPLLHPHVDELAKYIAEKKVFLNLATNAILIEDHMEAALMSSEVSVSLDGDLESHNANRGSNNFERCIKGIEKAMDAGATVRLCTVVTRHNFDRLDWLLEYAEKNNVYIYFSPLIDVPEDRKEQMEALRLPDEKVKEFFVKLGEAKKRSPRIINCMEGIEYMRDYPVSYKDIIWKDSPHADYYKEPCPYGRFQFLINSIGELYPCGNMWNNPDRFKPRIIFNDGIDEALRHASTDLPCQSCSFGNAPEWNNVTTLPWLWYGIRMTIKQAFGARRK